MRIFFILLLTLIGVNSFGDGKTFLEQGKVQFDSVYERQPTDWDQYFLELINYYRANPEEALIENFAEILKQADEWYDETDTSEKFKLSLPDYSIYKPENTVISTQVANALNIAPPNYTKFDTEIKKYKEWRELIETGNTPPECDIAHLDLIYLIYELEHKKEQVVATWASHLSKEQIKNIPEDLKLKIFNEGIFYIDDLLDFTPKPPLSMDSKLCQSTLNHLKWSTEADYMGHREDEDLSTKLGIPYFGNHSFERANYVAYKFITGQENLSFNAEAHLYPALNLEPWSESFLKEHFVMLFVDTGIYKRGHRLNLFNTFSNEVGISVVEIDNIRSKPWIATSANFMQKKEFAGQTLQPSIHFPDNKEWFDYNVGYISGVIYQDTNQNGAYSVTDDKISDYELWAEHVDTGEQFTDSTLFSTGGYKIKITKPGTYKVYARKAGCLPNTIVTKASVIHRVDAYNFFLTGLKVDFIDPLEQLVPAPLADEDREVTIKRKNSTILTASAEGFRNKYNWYFVTADGRTKVGEGTELNLNDVNIDVSGTYTCEITNEGGSAFQSFRVNVLDTLVLDIKDGWNLISLTRNIPESQLREIQNLSGLNFWFWVDNCYKIEPTKEPQKAITFWVNSRREGQVEVHGKRTDDDLPFTTGWSLGGVSESKFITVPDSVQVIYSWNNESSTYTEVAIDDNAQAFLEEAKGYWLFSL